jgi:hypothetical protein
MKNIEEQFIVSAIQTNGINLITRKGSATREDIVHLIMPTLSPTIPIEKRQHPKPKQ